MKGYHLLNHILFLIFTGTAILATFALFTRQSLLVAYIALGAMLGPWGFKLLNNASVIKQAGEIGIIFLLFLLGLHLQPQNLFHSMRKMSVLTLLSSIAFFLMGFIPTLCFGYSMQESFIIGLAAMFSSTIIGIKLLPTTILHHQHTGELVVSILLLQDVIAIATMLGLQLITDGQVIAIMWVVVAFTVLLGTAYLFQRYVLAWLLTRFDKIQEYIFILSLGWCLSMSELSHYFGLSEEIGAFIAGVAIATHPIAFYIAESLKPLRDFFLVLFFFSIGASFNFSYLPQVIIPAATLAIIILIGKPLVFSYLLQRSDEPKAVSKEIGIRLGQMSEFSLLLIYMALETHLVPLTTIYMAEAAIIFTFIVSCYLTVMIYPTPLAATDKLRRD